VSTTEIAQHTLLSCGLILAVGTLAAFAAQKIRIPDVAIFLIAGIVLGPHALGLVNIPAASAQRRDGRHPDPGPITQWLGAGSDCWSMADSRSTAP
jgi:hypothetical protein